MTSLSEDEIKALEDRLTEIPTWNHADQQLVAGISVNISRCSDPQQAKIFVANKIIFEWERQKSGHLNRVGLSLFKWKARMALLSTQIFGGRSSWWSGKETIGRAKALLLDLASDHDHKVQVNVGAEKYAELSELGGHWIEILQIAKKLNEAGATLILQGSQADGTTTPFSDIDLVLFGNLGNAAHCRLKYELDQIVLRADPLQHHGIFFYDLESQQRFSESVLPIATFQRATAISGPLDLNFSLLNDKYSPAMSLLSFVKTLKSFLSGTSPIRGMWDWKFRVSQFLLIPSLLAAVRGRYVYKGDSFKVMAPFFTPIAWQLIEVLTRVRQQWHLPQNLLQLDCYLSDKARVWGRLERDVWPVDQSAAIWNSLEFSESAGLFLQESLELAGLN